MGFTGGYSVLLFFFSLFPHGLFCLSHSKQFSLGVQIRDAFLYLQFFYYLFCLFILTKYVQFTVPIFVFNSSME